MRLRTANKNRRRALRRRVYAEGFAFHQAQLARGRDVSRSGYIRRHRPRPVIKVATPLYPTSALRDRYEGQNMGWVHLDIMRRRNA